MVYYKRYSKVEKIKVWMINHITKDLNGLNSMTVTFNYNILMAHEWPAIAAKYIMNIYTHQNRWINLPIYSKRIPLHSNIFKPDSQACWGQSGTSNEGFSCGSSASSTDSDIERSADRARMPDEGEHNQSRDSRSFRQFWYQND